MKPVVWRAAILDMLYMVANVNVKVPCVIIDVTNYDLGVGVVITLNGFNVKFTLEQMTAAVNSRRSIEIGLSGATLDLAERKLTCTLPLPPSFLLHSCAGLLLVFR